MKRFLTIGVLGGAVFLSSCAGMSDTQQRAMTGTAMGAAGGAIIGAIAGDAGVGALIGAGVGLAGGLVVDNQRQREQQAYDRGVQSGQQQKK
jgi:hypothetical protein